MKTRSFKIGMQSGIPIPPEVMTLRPMEKNPTYVAVFSGHPEDKRKKTCRVYLKNRMRNPIWTNVSYSSENVFAFADRMDERIQSRLPHGASLLWEIQLSAL